MTNPETAWRPSDQAVQRPADVAAIWQRLTELTTLDWPTQAEQVERIALVEWLNPASDSTITAMRVFEIAAARLNLSTQLAEEQLKPAIAVAEVVWTNLRLLTIGLPVAPARPELEHDDNERYDTWSDRLDAWREERRQQAKDWYASVMATLEDLLRAEVIYEFELPDITSSPQLCSALRHDFMRGVFDGPYAIGASMFLEPVMPGTGFGTGTEALAVADALALAAQDALYRLGRAREAEDTQAASRALSHLQFWWMMLKGFVYAGAVSQEGMMLPDMYLQQEGWWADARWALINGRDAVKAAHDAGIESARWISHGTSLQDKVANVVTEDLIVKMEQRLQQARQFRQAMRDLR